MENCNLLKGSCGNPASGFGSRTRLQSGEEHLGDTADTKDMAELATNLVESIFSFFKNS